MLRDGRSKCRLKGSRRFCSRETFSQAEAILCSPHIVALTHVNLDDGIQHHGERTRVSLEYFAAGFLGKAIFDMKSADTVSRSL
jgi:hypothetical protein